MFISLSIISIHFTVGYQGPPSEEARQKIFLHLSQVWKTPKWRRLVPEGVLHVNWDPFRPQRSHLQFIFYQNNILIAFCSEEDLTYILNPKTRTLVCILHQFCEEYEK